MADVKISALPELSEAPNASDVVPIVDVSASTTKKLTFTNIFSYLTGAISAVLTSNLAASRALVSSSGGKIDVSTVTSTEVGYLTGQTDYTNTRPIVNLLYNGNFDLWDRGTSVSASDDVYVAPGINHVTSSANSTISQQTASPPDGSRYFANIVIGNITQAGILFFLESQDAIPLRNKTVSLSFQVKDADGLTIKAIIASWAGAADTITSDIVSAWSASPTLAANWTNEGENTIVTTSSWQTLKVENVALDTASLNNIAVFIFNSTATGGASSTVSLAQVQLEIGAKATTFIPRPVAQEEILANRRFWRLTGDASGNGPAFHQRAGAASEALRFWIPFPVKMRTTPTGSVGGTWALVNCTGPTLGNTSPQGSSMIITSSASGLASAQTNGTDDYLQFDAEL